MAFSPESEPPVPPGDPQTPERGPTTPPDGPGNGEGEPALTPQQLARVVERLDSGFYDRVEIREEIARRAREDLSA